MVLKLAVCLRSYLFCSANDSILQAERKRTDPLGQKSVHVTEHYCRFRKFWPS